MHLQEQNYGADVDGVNQKLQEESVFSVALLPTKILFLK